MKHHIVWFISCDIGAVMEVVMAEACLFASIHMDFSGAFILKVG